MRTAKIVRVARDGPSNYPMNARRPQGLNLWRGSVGTPALSVPLRPKGSLVPRPVALVLLRRGVDIICRAWYFMASVEGLACSFI
jgi:hypothetical protein